MSIDAEPSYAGMRQGSRPRWADRGLKHFFPISTPSGMGMQLLVDESGPAGKHRALVDPACCAANICAANKIGF